MIVVGLMSGTSLDGISAAVVRFGRTGSQVTAETLAFDVAPYATAQRDRLARALVAGSPEEYCRLGFDLGEWFAAAALQVMAQAGVARGEIAAIASHGQTVWHVPGHSTWQLGEAAVIAERTGLRVVSDFRVRDVAAGGQGAPLVAIADQLLFSDALRFRALQNLGGIGNVTIVPPDGVAGTVRAFDTGPGVVVMDGVMRAIDPGRRFDEDGQLARQGKPIAAVVDSALRHDYFSETPPKSTGRELFTPQYVRDFVAACQMQQPGATPADLMATAVSFTAASIADAYRRFVPEPLGDVVLSGGGAKNPALVEAITTALAPTPVALFDTLFFDGEAKEAVAFALLGYLHLSGLCGNVPSATGARGPRVLGKLTPP